MQADIDMLQAAPHRSRGPRARGDGSARDARRARSRTLDGDAATAARPTSTRLQAVIAAAEAEIDAEAGAEAAARAEVASGIAPNAAARLRDAAARRTAAPAPRGSSARRARRATSTIPSTEAERIRRSAGDGRRVLRQLRRDPRPVTQLPAVRTDDRRRSTREVLVYCDGGSRGNPGPSAIGAVVLDPTTDPPTRARDGERDASA